MKKLILLLSFFNICVCFSQNIELPVINVKLSECDRFADITRIQKRIISQRMNNDTLTVLFGTIENCAGIHDIKAFISGDTLKFYYSVGSFYIDTAANGDIQQNISITECDCCFEFSFSVDDVRYQPQVIKLNDKIYKYYPDKYITYPVKYDIVDNDTVNYIDKFGLKQGKWLIPERDNGANFVGYYVDNQLKSCFSQMYNSNHKLIYEKKQTDFNTYVITDFSDNEEIVEQLINYDNKSHLSYEYYSDKRLKKIIFKNSKFEEKVEFYENGMLKIIENSFSDKEFYENGKLKFERLYSRNADHIWSKTYYDNGNLMSITYYKNGREIRGKIVKKYRNGQGKLIREVIHTGSPRGKFWYKYYDINGKRVSKEYLEKKGYKELLNE